jgi:hypothetical protein
VKNYQHCLLSATCTLLEYYLHMLSSLSLVILSCHIRKELHCQTYYIQCITLELYLQCCNFILKATIYARRQGDR